MKKLLYIFIISFSLIGFSQDEENNQRMGFSVKAGANLVDSNGGWEPFGFLTSFEEQAFSRPFELGLEYRFSRLFAVGVDGSINKWKKDEGVIDHILLGKDMNYFAVDGKFKLFLDEAIGVFKDWDWLDIYLDGGLGYFAINADEAVKKDGAVSFNAGVGANVWLTDNIGVYIDGTSKFRNKYTTPLTNHFQYAAGVMYNFGGAPKEKWDCDDVNKVDDSPKIMDSDEDGVLDPYDRCPNVKGLVFNGGCPDEDTDGDGILDSKDQCPYLPAPESPDGCPNPDVDKDGVLNAADKCPKVYGPVTNNGCPQDPEEVIPPVRLILSNVYFDTNQSIIKPQYFKVLNDNASIMKSTPGKKYYLIGHTDSRGSEVHNRRLSQGRAEAVKAFLVKRGVDANSLIIEYKASAQPDSDNVTQQGRARNRRVEVIDKNSNQ